ncbi:hypothetical protein HMPREF0866_02653 [Ruminococcaceae bacterium D16]|nr:hypothetical protein HMPREF0866_02653 [Ruminococcaceae bacterium D16]
MKGETKGSRTKQQLYRCAMELFREKGYDQVSVDEIVRKAGTAKGTFYIYFSSKADIITEMLRQYDDYYDQVAAGLDPTWSVERRLGHMIQASCRFTQDVIGLDLIRVLYIREVSGSGQEVRELNEERTLFHILVSLLEEGQRTGQCTQDMPAQELAMLILRGIRATFFEWCCQDGALDLTQEALCFWTVFSQGLFIKAKQ